MPGSQKGRLDSRTTQRLHVIAVCVHPVDIFISGWMTVKTTRRGRTTRDGLASKDAVAGSCSTAVEHPSGPTADSSVNVLAAWSSWSSEMCWNY